jgi:isocitrate/isopropylmalate dehydrogenase
MYKVNPTAMLLATKMMLEWLGEGERAQRLERAIAAVIKEGKVRTYDLKGTSTTLEIARAVAERL